MKSKASGRDKKAKIKQTKIIMEKVQIGVQRVDRRTARTLTNQKFARDQKWRRTLKVISLVLPALIEVCSINSNKHYVVAVEYYNLTMSCCRNQTDGAVIEVIKKLEL